MSESHFCGFCARAEHEVSMLVKGAAANICDECVELACEAVARRQAGEPELRTYADFKAGVMAPTDAGEE